MLVCTSLKKRMLSGSRLCFFVTIQTPTDTEITHTHTHTHTQIHQLNDIHRRTHFQTSTEMLLEQMSF